MTNLEKKRAERNRVSQSAEGNELGELSKQHIEPIAPPAPDWPEPMATEAYYGLAGKFVGNLEPASESDPVALLVQFLLGVGNAIGRTAHAKVEGDCHYLNEFAVLVGKSEKAEKAPRGECSRASCPKPMKAGFKTE